MLVQVLQEAKGRLRNEILDRLDAAKKAGDHASVLRFTRLYAPLGLQVCPSAQSPNARSTVALLPLWGVNWV